MKRELRLLAALGFSGLVALVGCSGGPDEPSATGESASALSSRCDRVLCPEGTHCVETGLGVNCVPDDLPIVDVQSGRSAARVSCSTVLCPQETHCEETRLGVRCVP